MDTLDLWHTHLPEINGATLDAVYAVKHGQPHSLEQLHAWPAVVDFADHFKSADKYLISVPMWNFSVPYKLKHYIELLVHRGLTFSFAGGRIQRARQDKPLVAVYARGGAYAPGSGSKSRDHQSRCLSFIGFTDVREIFFEPTEASPSSRVEAPTVAKRKAAELAALF